eukprot:751404-Hanusia_phi.AAC.5
MGLGLMKWTPLHAAAYMGMVEVNSNLRTHHLGTEEAELLASISDISAFPSLSRTTELCCRQSSRGFPDVCETLMEIGADWHAKDFLSHVFDLFLARVYSDEKLQDAYDVANEDENEPVPEAPDWAHHSREEEEEEEEEMRGAGGRVKEEESKVTCCQVDGKKYLLQVATACVYERKKPYRYLGLLRKDSTIDFGARQPGERWRMKMSTLIMLGCME